MNKKFLHCQSLQICQEDNRSWGFIVIGFISTVAIRVVTILMRFDPLYGDIAWYVG